MHTVLLVFDIGSSGLKASLMDEDLNILRNATTPYPTRRRVGGVVEQDAADWWMSAVRAMLMLRELVPEYVKRVDAVGICGHMWGCLPMDRDGQPLQRAMIYSDRRAEPWARTLQERFGSDYFYSCAYEGRVYQVSRLLTEALVQGSWESWCATRPADLGTAELHSIQIIRGSGVLEWQKTKTERVLSNNQLETDTDGNVIYDEAVALNGEAAAAEQWDTLVDRLAALTVSGKIPADYSAEGKSPRWQIVLTTEGGTVRTIAAYPLDTFSDALMVDGVIRYYVHIEALDSVLGEFSGSLTD